VADLLFFTETAIIYFSPVKVFANVIENVRFMLLYFMHDIIIFMMILYLLITFLLAKIFSGKWVQ